ncbi:MAG TPA: hypothetical protein VNS19_20535 [Acidimicrobiales bacterium]|nr:hypothetical protein [Acidimicrobiales bacterium]
MVSGGGDGDPPAVEDDRDDERWPDDEEAPRRAGVSPMAMVFGAIAVLALIVVLVATSGSDDPSKDETAQTSLDETTSGPTTGSTGGATSEATDATTTAPKGPSWPAVVQGRPAAFGELHDPITGVDPEAEPGVYVWMDYDGWHAWVVDPSGKEAAKGTITSNEPFKDASPAEPGQGVVALDGTTLLFDASGVDAEAAGVTFNLGFYADEVTVNLNGTDLPLLLGSEAKASPLPTVISKAVQPS